MRAGSQTQDTCSGALIVLFLLLSQASASCTISDVMRVDSIVTSCCESQVDGNCADGFPATCTHSCATVLVPYWAECAGMVTSLGDATFPTFQISELSEFVGPCIQTINLYEHAATSTCANANLAAQVEAINTACCEQNGEYVCGDGAPSVCDAECAFAFIPYWMNCIVLDDELHDIADIREFQDLHNICAEEMDAGEVAILYDDVVGLAQNPSCHIDTSGIILRPTRRLLNPPARPTRSPLRFASSSSQAVNSLASQTCAHSVASAIRVTTRVNFHAPNLMTLELVDGWRR